MNVARFYPYLVFASTAVGVVAALYLVLLRIVRDRRSR